MLILVDAMRCPRAKRGATLKRYYNHLAKRIYAAASSHPGIDTFGQLREFVDLQRRPRFLDGPNDVDWIVPNEILSEREQGIYVDFLQDTTEPPGDYFWSVPFEPSPSGPSYVAPDAFTLAGALADAGAASADGLATIAAEWRHFDPSPDGDRGDVQDLIERMLNSLIRQGAATGDQTSMEFIYTHWTFPLWPLDLSLDADYPSDDDLRDVRAEFIRRLEATAARRDPPPGHHSRNGRGNGQGVRRVGPGNRRVRSQDLSAPTRTWHPVPPGQRVRRVGPPTIIRTVDSAASRTGHRRAHRATCARQLCPRQSPQLAPCHPSRNQDDWSSWR